MAEYAIHYAKAVGVHGTPSWNPQPHPEADPDVVARRDSDPLWGYHRGLIGYSGYPIRNFQEQMMEGKPNAYHAVLHTQYAPEEPGAHSYLASTYGTGILDHTATIPVGMVTRREVLDSNLDRRRDADKVLTSNPRIEDAGGELHQQTESNLARYNLLWGRGGGRRPWYNTIFPLQNLEWYAAPHDPYRLLAQAVHSGNRHALPALVDLLKKRDNPAGWYKGWTALAKAMEERIGDLPAEDVLRRSRAIASVTARHSRDPHGHEALSTAAHATEDITPLMALADHMDENGLPQYAQLLRLELANVHEPFRWKPKRKGGRL